MKNIIVLSVGRSDYDRYFPIIDALNNNSKINVSLYLTQAHQNKIFGHTISFVDKKFKILKKKLKPKKTFNLEKQKEITKNFSEDLLNLSEEIRTKKPDFLIVLGDRYEMLLGPVAATPYNIPVIHFYGGAVTEGAIDELIRHSITKMSHFHFVALDVYKKRLMQLGEEEWRIKNIGIHELKYLKKIKKFSKDELTKKYNFNFKEPYLLVTYHPVTLELKNLNYQLKSLSYALKKSKYNIVFTYPNADPGYDKIIKFIRKQFNNKKKFMIFKNAGHKTYSSLIKNSCAIVGNSSSGIVEAASFKKPVVNIGTRQNGKFMPINIINSKYDKKSILRNLTLALSKKFNVKIKNLINPYESNTSVKNIVNLILKLKNNDKLLRKKFKNII